MSRTGPAPLATNPLATNPLEPARREPACVLEPACWKEAALRVTGA